MSIAENDVVLEAETDAWERAQRAAMAAASRRRRWLVGSLRVAIVVVVLAVWQLVVSLQLVARTALVGPLDLVNQFIVWFGDGFIWPHILSSLFVFAVGFGLGLLVGVVLGVIGGTIPFIRFYMAPFIAFFNALPRLVMIPFFILLLGYTDGPGIVVTALSVVFLVIVTVMAGMNEIGVDYVQNARALGATRLQLLTSVYLPGVAIWIFAAARSSAGMAFQTAIVAQYFASSVGLGFLIATGANELNASLVFGAIVITAALAIVVDLLLRFIGSRFERPDLVR